MRGAGGQRRIVVTQDVLRGRRDAFYKSHGHPMSIRSLDILLCIQMSNADLGLFPSGPCVSGQSYKLSVTDHPLNPL